MGRQGWRPHPHRCLSSPSLPSPPLPLLELVGECPCGGGALHLLPPSSLPSLSFLAWPEMARPYKIGSGPRGGMARYVLLLHGSAHYSSPGAGSAGHAVTRSKAGAGAASVAGPAWGWGRRPWWATRTRRRLWVVGSVGCGCQGRPPLLSLPARGLVLSSAAGGRNFGSTEGGRFGERKGKSA